MVFRLEIEYFGPSTSVLIRLQPMKGTSLKQKLVQFVSEQRDLISARLT